MANDGENFAAFNSRALVEMVGDVTDEALKATKIKQFLAVLAGDFSIGQDVNPCLLCIWESSAALLKWQQQQHLGSMVTDSVFCSVHPLVNPMYCWSMVQFQRSSLTK